LTNKSVILYQSNSSEICLVEFSIALFFIMLWED